MVPTSPIDLAQVGRNDLVMAYQKTASTLDRAMKGPARPTGLLAPSNGAAACCFRRHWRATEQIFVNWKSVAVASRLRSRGL